MNQRGEEDKMISKTQTEDSVFFLFNILNQVQ